MEEDDSYRSWHQGDVTLDVTRLPFSNASDEILDVAVAGAVVVTQTCDILNDAAVEGGLPPVIQVAAIVGQPPEIVEAVRLGRMPRFLYLPSVADRNLVANLDLIATVERSILQKWERVPLPDEPQVRRDCAFALARHRERPALPDRWHAGFKKLSDWVRGRASRDSDEARFVLAIEEMRLLVSDETDNPTSVDVICIIPKAVAAADRAKWAGEMLPKLKAKIDPSWQSKVDFRLTSTAEMTAEEYLTSIRLDIDALTRTAQNDNTAASEVDADPSRAALAEPLETPTP